MPHNVMVIGIGNPLRGDDALGSVVIERLAARTPAGCDLVSVHQLTPELAEPLSRAKGAVFVDAAADVAPGEVRVAPLGAVAGDGAFSHGLDPDALLAVALRLYGAVPAAVMVSVGAASFEFQAPLSPAVERAVDAVVARVIEAAGSF